MTFCLHALRFLQRTSGAGAGAAPSGDVASASSAAAAGASAASGPIRHVRTDSETESNASESTSAYSTSTMTPRDANAGSSSGGGGGGSFLDSAAAMVTDIAGRSVEVGSAMAGAVAGRVAGTVSDLLLSAGSGGSGRRSFSTADSAVDSAAFTEGSTLTIAFDQTATTGNLLASGTGTGGAPTARTNMAGLSLEDKQGDASQESTGGGGGMLATTAGEELLHIVTAAGRLFTYSVAIPGVCGARDAAGYKLLQDVNLHGVVPAAPAVAIDEGSAGAGAVTPAT